MLCVRGLVGWSGMTSGLGKKIQELQTLPTKKDMSSYVRVLARAEEPEARSSLFFAARGSSLPTEQSNLAS